MYTSHGVRDDGSFMYSPKWPAVAIILVGINVSTPTVTGKVITQHPGCQKTFTTDMFRNAAITAYKGTRTPTRLDLVHLQHFMRCARHPWTRTIDRRIWARSKAMNAARKQAAIGPTNYSTASWYNDAGATASGWHAYYGVANKTMAFGTKIKFYYHGRSVVATVDDRGPYISGREWDLNQNTASAEGFSGVDIVGWRVVQ